jgi:hypothetical protein
LQLYGEDRENERIKVNPSELGVLLKFCPSSAANPLDTFVLALERAQEGRSWEGNASVKILISPDDEPLKRIRQRAKADVHSAPRLDRLSKILRSGKSVSVAIRTRGDRNRYLGYLHDVLDITIDDNGKLL